MTTTAEDILRLAHVYAIKGEYEPFRTAVESLVAERDALRKLFLEYVSHNYEGDCPDELDRDRRDPNCPACMALRGQP